MVAAASLTPEVFTRDYYGVGQPVLIRGGAAVAATGAPPPDDYDLPTFLARHGGVVVDGGEIPFADSFGNAAGDMRHSLATFIEGGSDSGKKANIAFDQAVIRKDASLARLRDLAPHFALDLCGEGSFEAGLDSADHPT